MHADHVHDIADLGPATGCLVSCSFSDVNAWSIQGALQASRCAVQASIGTRRAYIADRWLRHFERRDFCYLVGITRSLVSSRSWLRYRPAAQQAMSHVSACYRMNAKLRRRATGCVGRACLRHPRPSNREARPHRLRPGVPAPQNHSRQKTPYDVVVRGPASATVYRQQVGQAIQNLQYVTLAHFPSWGQAESCQTLVPTANLSTFKA